jgi:hypothetical protein
VSTRTGALIWFGVAGAPLAWALQLVVGYALEEAACPPGGIGDSGVEPATAALSAVAGALAVLAIGTALRVYRSAPTGSGSERDLMRFLAGAGLIAGVVFLGAIVASGLMLVSLDPCEPA